jgi:hypothetical protein
MFKMSVETRHTEKNLLFSLLQIKDMKDVKLAIARLIATMEPEDVELVKKQIMDLEKEA